jgi:hypothetical protein
MASEKRVYQPPTFRVVQLEVKAQILGTCQTSAGGLQQGTPVVCHVAVCSL